MESYRALIETAYTNAENNISNITNEIIAMPGVIGKNTRHFYNNLLNTEDARYLEIRSWKGISVCSAMCGNKAKVTCIVNESGETKEKFVEKFAKFKGENEASFIETDWLQVDVSSLSKYNICMYDGCIGMESQYKALSHYYDCLDDIFMYVSWKEDRDGTLEAIEKLHLKILYEKEVRLTWDDSTNHEQLAKDTWWNGMYVTVLQK